MKKIIELILVMIMTMSLFAGWNTGTIGGGQLQIDEELPYEMDESGRVLDDYFKDVEVEWWFSSNYTLKSDMYLFTKLEEVIGCKIKVVSYYAEQY